MNNGMETVLRRRLAQRSLETGWCAAGKRPSEARRLQATCSPKRRTAIKFYSRSANLTPAFIDNEILLADTANGKPLFGAQGRFRLVRTERQTRGALGPDADKTRSCSSEEVAIVKTPRRESTGSDSKEQGGGRFGPRTTRAP